MTPPEEDDPSAVLFVKLYTKILNDPVMMTLTLAEFGLWTLGALIAKDSVTDGELHELQLRREVAMRGGDLALLGGAIEGLTDAGLWERTGDQTYQIANWLKYNKARLALTEERSARSRDGRRGNHQKWHVDRKQPKTGCEFCVAEGLVIGGGDRPRSGGEPLPDRTRSPEKEKEKEKEKEPERSTGEKSEPQGKAEAAAVALADRLFEIIGLTDPADRGWQRRVGRALHNGWTADQIEDLAHDAFATADNPKAYLKTCIDGKANTKPEPTNPNGSGGGGGGGRVNEADLAWATVCNLIAREGAQSFLTVAQQTGCLDSIALKAATDVRQIIRYQDQVSAKIAFRNAYNAAATQGATT